MGATSLLRAVFKKKKKEINKRLVKLIRKMWPLWSAKAIIRDDARAIRDIIKQQSGNLNVIISLKAD